MPLSRLTQLWADVEAAYADAVALTAADAVLVKDLDVKVERAKYNRSMDGNTLSRMRASALGMAYCTISFTLALRGNAVALAAGVEPIYGRFLRGCGFVGAWDATPGSENWLYKPTVAGAQGQSLAFQVYYDGLMRSIIGARGTFTGTLTPGDVVLLKFSFEGLYREMTEVTAPAGTYTAEVDPPILMGSEFKPFAENPATDVFGQPYGSSFDVRNVLKRVGSSSVAAASSYTGLSRIVIVGRGDEGDPGMGGTMQVEQKTTDPDDWWERWRLRTTSASCAWKIGTAAGNRHLITYTKIELDSIQQGDSDGVLVHDCDIRLLGSASKDDELTFTSYKNVA
jgi:hypothetical protein